MSAFFRPSLRHLTWAIVFLAVPFMLGGCAEGMLPTNQGRSAVTNSQDLTADQARSLVVSIGREVVAAIGTSKWTFIAGPTPDECTLENGATGVMFSWAARGPATADHQAHAIKASAALRAQGYEVTIQTVSGEAVRVVGRKNRLGVAEFDTRATADGVVVTSSCGVGAVADYLNQKPEGLEAMPSTEG